MFHVNGDGPEFELNFNNVRWTTDATVDGTGTWNQDTGRVTASLQVDGPGGLTATVEVVYDDYTPSGSAALNGASGGKEIAATVPTP